MACCEKLTADERIEHSNLQTATSSMILIWSFADPINPQVICSGRIYFYNLSSICYFILALLAVLRLDVGFLSVMPRSAISFQPASPNK